MDNWHHLRGARSSLILASPDGGIPQLVYWGRRLDEEIDNESLALLTSLPRPCGFLDDFPPLSLVPEAGRGFLGEAGLALHRNRRDWGGQFRLARVECPVSQTRIFHCTDAVAGLALEIRVEMDGDSDVFGVRAELCNLAGEAVLLDRLGVSLPLPAEADELLTFHGRWTREFMTERTPWPGARLVKENRRGRTSHDSFPAMIAGTAGFGETRGEVYGIHLAWSGNHRLVAEKLPQGGRHLQAAEWLYPGEISLAEGERYSTPWIYGSWSGEGLNGMSQQFHRFLRDRLALDVRSRPRPVHLNTWEAMYFEHRPERLLELVALAADVGVERFILDDGWFIGRDDDHAGLGDWFVDEDKHPGGLDYLVDAVQARGMQFGLWFEPEMVNENSALFRRHPDWILQLPGYEQPLGRNQYVLDLANPDVFAYLYERIDHFLSRYRIDYIKWDMNRDLAQPGHEGIASVHAQTEAFYRLLGEIRRAHPDVEIETCASGGGRPDFEVLRHCQRIWVSDCIDALERQRIQYGYSLFLPPEVMGSHISESRAHTTGRRHSLSFRLITALFGHMGLELDLARLSRAERDEVAQMLNVYKRYRGLLHSGVFHRLDVPDPSLNAYGVVSEEGGEALFAVAALEMPAQIQLPRLRLTGLDPAQRYRVAVQVAPEARTNQVAPSEFYRREQGLFSGEWLMRFGLPLPLLHPESAFLIHLEAKQTV